MDVQNPTELSPSEETHRSVETPVVEAPTRTPTTVRWFRPPVDVFESDHAFRLDVDVPGVRVEDVELTVDGGVLTLEARRDATRGWRRQLRLTDGVEVEAIDAQLEAGVLTLTLPKAAKARARRIEVR